MRTRGLRASAQGATPASEGIGPAEGMRQDIRMGHRRLTPGFAERGQGGDQSRALGGLHPLDDHRDLGPAAGGHVLDEPPPAVRDGQYRLPAVLGVVAGDRPDRR